MDLVGAESRRGGTRGGRNEFKWDSVKRNEREYYLGNSVAGVKTRWSVPEAPSPAASAGAADELATVRRREQSVRDAALGGQSFADAVRSALMETCEDVDDERGKRSPDERMDVQRPATREERAAKAQRKLQRGRRREERRARRAERARRRAARSRGKAPAVDSSESERESMRSRTREDAGGSRRRRKERERGRKRAREWISSSDMDESETANARRTRVR